MTGHEPVAVIECICLQFVTICSAAGPYSAIMDVQHQLPAIALSWSIQPDVVPIPWTLNDLKPQVVPRLRCFILHRGWDLLAATVSAREEHTLRQPRLACIRNRLVQSAMLNRQPLSAKACTLARQDNAAVGALLTRRSRPARKVSARGRRLKQAAKSAIMLQHCCFPLQVVMAMGVSHSADNRGVEEISGPAKQTSSPPAAQEAQAFIEQMDYLTEGKGQQTVRR